MRSFRAVLGATLVSATLALAAPAGTATASAPVSAQAVLPAPTGLAAVRNPADPVDFTVTWKAVPGVHHYNVSVYWAGEDHVTIVPAGTTTLRVEGVDLRTTYRITVSTRDAAGAGSTTGPVWLNPAVPGAPRALTVTRQPTAVDAQWQAPAWPGASPIGGYRVVVTRLADKVDVADTVVTATSFSLGDIDPARQYAIKVTARNSLGDGPTAATNVLGDKPASPAGVTAVRDAATPLVVHVSWPAVAGDVTHYEVLHGAATANSAVRVDAPQTSVDVQVVPDKSVIFTVRACGSRGCGNPTRPVRLPKPGDTVRPSPASATTSPWVEITDTAGAVTVRTKGTIGSASLYPRLVVRVEPTTQNGGFRDVQVGQNGAQTMTFRTVPNGTYYAKVFGLSGTGAETELARKVVLVGDPGAMTGPEWQVVFGRADLSRPSTVDMPFSGEHRVLSTRPRTSQDMTLATTATLKGSGSWGYGIWFRASLNASGKISGYTFQYDPKYGNKFIIRHWYNGTECPTPLASKAFPSGFQEFDVPHDLVVVANGDTVWASVDGIEMFRLPSLSQAIATSPCAYPVPTGTRIGFRTWSTSPSTFVNTTFN